MIILLSIVSIAAIAFAYLLGYIVGKSIQDTPAKEEQILNHKS